MDFMLENTDRDLVMFEFDTYWAIRGGQDPIAWIRKFGKRCDLLHQKDLPAAVRPVNLFDLSIQNQDMKLMDMFKTISPEQFTEIGAGIIDIPEIIEAGRTHGNARYIIVEQDMTSKTELDSITISYKNLIRLLNGV
jgi:sugar phosphate isomerase/epimerase